MASGRAMQSGRRFLPLRNVTPLLRFWQLKIARVLRPSGCAARERRCDDAWTGHARVPGGPVGPR